VAPLNNNLAKYSMEVFNKLTMQQRIMLGGVVAAAFILLGVTLFYMNEPTYSTLYSNLAQEDASKVVETLTAQKVPYKIEDNGQTIKVQKDKVYETRLSLASKGIPSTGVIGYEIFDKTTVGMSEFMQKLNYKRAIEGELARTIGQQEGVEGVRVSIVIPQKAVFKEEEKPTTASVVLKLKNNYNPTKTYITAITNLVSSSVEGLTQPHVTIIDTKGRLLSKEVDESPLATSSSKQYEVKQQIENYLSQKAQSILDNIVGYGNSMVQITADVDFAQVEKTMETYDPDSQVAISQQTIQSNNNGRNLADSTAQTNQNNTVNYEISKTIAKVIEGSGNIKRLSVSAVINDEVKEVWRGNKNVEVYKPRPQDQMKKLEEIVKNAVGVDPKRNDQFSIVNLSFETKPLDDGKNENGNGFFDNVNKFSNVILILVAIGASIFILRSLMLRVKKERLLMDGETEQPEIAGGTLAIEGASSVEGVENGVAPQLLQPPPKKPPMLPVGNIEDEISEEAIEKQQQQEKIINYIQKNPADTAKLINAWLHEDEF
jgi:flagellar M-ring protein FliF